MTLSLPPLLDADTLAAHLDDPTLRIFDATASLDRTPGRGPYVVRSGHEDYLRAHVPGAAFADTAGKLSDPDAPWPLILPSAEYFAAAASALGIGDQHHVVVYAQAAPTWATRLWWLLRYFGHEAVSVLDGGLPDWIRAGFPVEGGERHYPPAQFTASPRPELTASKDDVLAVVEHRAQARLVNALRPSVFRGEGVTSYSRPGRIPGSENVPHTALVDHDSGRFISVEKLRALLQEAGAFDDQPLIAYCGGGISATAVLFALSLTGREDARLYDGSLTEWSADPDLPLEIG